MNHPLPETVAYSLAVEPLCVMYLSRKQPRDALLSKVMSSIGLQIIGDDTLDKDDFVVSRIRDALKKVPEMQIVNSPPLEDQVAQFAIYATTSRKTFEAIFRTKLQYIDDKEKRELFLGNGQFYPAHGLDLVGKPAPKLPPALEGIGIYMVDSLMSLEDFLKERQLLE